MEAVMSTAGSESNIQESLDEPITLRIKGEGETLIVQVSGDACQANADLLSTGLNRLSATAPKQVILDLSGLTFLSGPGLGAIVAFRRSIVNRGGTFGALCTSTPVRDVLHRSRLDVFLAVRDQPSRVMN